MYGDVGGAVTELVITCKTSASGVIAITKGDALVLVGAYEVNHATKDNGSVFGQALSSATENSVSIPVKVRGICIFDYVGEDPVLDGIRGIVTSNCGGRVKNSKWRNVYSSGLIVKVDVKKMEVHVLL